MTYLKDTLHVRRTLEALDRYRAEDLRRIVPWMFAIGMLSIAAATFLLFIDRRGALWTLMGGGFLLMILYGGHRNRIKRAFKDDLMPAIMARVDPALDHYDPAGLPREQFEATSLFGVEPDTYGSKDLFGGLLGSTAVAFAMVRAVAESANMKDRPGGVVFEGLLFIADFNKHFHGRTHMKAGGAGIFASMRDEHVELENPRFARAFAVTCTDQIEARYILTPRLMERLLSLWEGFGSVDAVFEDSLIVLALGAPYELLDPMFTDGIGAKDFDEMVAKLKEVVAIVEDLDLNTRIWSKKPVARTA
jgi:hypothetical protein